MISEFLRFLTAVVGISKTGAWASGRQLCSFHLHNCIIIHLHSQGVCPPVRFVLMWLHFTPSHLSASRRRKVETTGLRQ